MPTATCTEVWVINLPVPSLFKQILHHLIDQLSLRGTGAGSKAPVRYLVHCVGDFNTAIIDFDIDVELHPDIYFCTEVACLYSCRH